jgi:hypothetical protein
MFSNHKILGGTTMLALIPNRSRPILIMIANICLMTIAPTALQASTVTFYTTSSSFNAAEPGLPIEGFSNANVAPGSLSLQSSPLSSATNNSIFSSGSMLPGITISNSNPLNTPGLIVYGAGAIYGSSNTVGTNWFGDALDLSFAPGVTAVGAYVFAATSPGQTLGGLFTADVFNGSTILGSTSFSEALGGFGFIGVSSTTPITNLRLLYVTNDATTFAGNIAFGSPGAIPIPPPPPPTPGPPTSPVPEPSTFTLLALGATSLGFLRRKNQGKEIEP